MKHLFFFTISFFVFFSSYGQEQIRLKFGAAKSFRTGNNNSGLHRTGGYASPLPSGIGLEYFRPLPERRAGLLVGAFFDVQGYSAGLNQVRFRTGIGGFGFGSQYGSVKIYGGLEKILSKNRRPGANSLSVIAGAALGINAMGVRGKMGGPERTGITLKGDTYRGVHLNEPEGTWTDGYYFIVDAKTANTFTPEIFAGLRWNINNRRAETIFIVEGIVNYSLMPKVYIEFPYTLNGQPMKDRINNYGFNAQLNVLIPLKTFMKH
ncbi:MAG: hypothetical protein ABI172_13810 [Ginsengibacter sp.]